MKKLKRYFWGLIAIGLVIGYFITLIGFDMFLIFVGCCLVFGSLGYALWRFLLAKPQESESKDSHEKKEFKFIPGTYKRAYLLTAHELSFYTRLKPIADKLGLVILAKIRMADLVKPNASDKYYETLFRRVSQKHVDFALCRPEDLRVELLIELDDSSHIPGNERDTLVEDIYKSTGYRLLRTFDDISYEQVAAALASVPGTQTKVSSATVLHNGEPFENYGSY